MKTYQDLLALGDDENARMNFVFDVIKEHLLSNAYNTALVADEYNRHRNRTIMNYRKLLYDLSGREVPDNFSANYKLASGFFNRFVTQETQFLLGNGVTWENEATKQKLGEDFDQKLQQAGENALVHGITFGFWNFDHIEIFDILHFAPLYDEENGALMAGVRFWQIDKDKPLRATLYETDGYTDYIQERGERKILHEKQSYIKNVTYSEADGTEIYDGENYPNFPIVPLWGNPYKQSEIVGIREQIDCYDLIKSGFANDLDDASQIYWTIQNAGGMDDIDLVKFIEHMKTVKAAVVDDQAQAQAHTLEVPSESRERLLDRLRADMYRDYMALDTDEIASGAVTATQIRAAYEPMNSKADKFEYCVLDFLQGIMKVAGIEDKPTFTRSMLVNVQEEIQTLISASTILDEEYLTRRILTLLGDGDKADEILKRMDAENMERLNMADEEEEENIKAV